MGNILEEFEKNLQKIPSAKIGYWTCKKHGLDCKSYVRGITKELNKGRKPTKDELKLVEFVDVTS